MQDFSIECDTRNGEEFTDKVSPWSFSVYFPSVRHQETNINGLKGPGALEPLLQEVRVDTLKDLYVTQFDSVSSRQE